MSTHSTSVLPLLAHTYKDELAPKPTIPKEESKLLTLEHIQQVWDKFHDSRS
ncbi:hypothetical protein DPMN_182954 [Dreissena polymorpha]|uniref:Uncharacterized protein n=1 Tax=Dreissena polymorpha TaxID=45954 RepID=A0A9D4I5Y1_DREPO|nr:hypothetical protein DPMN_182954 [Dreissena polymorpha]